MLPLLNCMLVLVPPGGPLPLAVDEITPPTIVMFVPCENCPLTSLVKLLIPLAVRLNNPAPLPECEPVIEVNNPVEPVTVVPDIVVALTDTNPVKLDDNDIEAVAEVPPVSPILEPA